VYHEHVSILWVERLLPFVMLDGSQMDHTTPGQRSSRGRDDDYGHDRMRFVVPPAAARPADRPRANEPSDTELVALDGDVVGLAESYLKTGRLTEPQREMLSARQASVEQLAARLEGPALTYAHQLLSLARSILEATAEP
jgi:hypothetical protein